MRFDNSLPCNIPQMDLLSVPNTQSVVESGSWFLIPAEADFQTGSVIFKIQGDDCYIDLPETELLLTLSTVKTRFYSHGVNLERSRIPPWRYKSGAEIFFFKFIYTTPAI